MRYARPAPKPVYATRAQLEAGAHYATHVSQPVARHPMAPVDDDEMDRLQHSCDPQTARGIPSSFNYKAGVLRVWPWPAEGWQVWSAVSNRDVTP